MKRKIILAIMLILTLTFTIPIGNLVVHAAPLEDCDLDGFDDSTGVPVPWPGYDETRGDTPAGPGGSITTTPTTVTSSNVNNSTDINNGSSTREDTNIANTTSDANSENIGTASNKTTNNIETIIEDETEEVYTVNETDVSYIGEEFGSQKLEVRPKPVNSFWDALSVGLTSENKGLVPGLIILLALSLAGGSAILFSSVVKRRKNISK